MTQTVDGTTGSDNPIKHIVIIMQENHSFDNYFGTYPGANKIPANTCMPIDLQNITKGCVKPFHTINFTNVNMHHSYLNATQSIDNGKMDGFVAVTNDNHTMSYYDNSTISNYWKFAAGYVLADNFFSSVPGESETNHWYSVAGISPEILFNNTVSKNSSPSIQNQFLAEANGTKTIADIFMNNSISWKYYESAFQVNGYKNAKTSGKVYTGWNPFSAKFSSYTSSYSPHFATQNQIFADLRNNALPQVSWFVPDIYHSEHPPASVRIGMVWVTKVVDAVMNSPEWNSTAIIITWDEYGAFYDHVVPPTPDKLGNGIRVPAIIISPYAKSGYIDHTSYDFESILKFIEWRYSLPSLTVRDQNASNLLNAFNFTQNPMPPRSIILSKNDLATLTPIYLTPSSGHPNDVIQIVGNGFGQNQTNIAIKFDSTTAKSGITANSTGSFKTTFQAPSGATKLGCHNVVDSVKNGISNTVCFTIVQ